MMMKTLIMQQGSPSRQLRPNPESKERRWSGGAASKGLRKSYLVDNEKRALDSIEMRPDNEDEEKKRGENLTGKKINLIEVSRSEATLLDYCKPQEEKSTRACTKNTPPSSKRRKKRGRWPTTMLEGEVRIPRRTWPIGLAQNVVSSIRGATTRVNVLLVLEYH